MEKKQKPFNVKITDEIYGGHFVLMVGYNYKKVKKMLESWHEGLDYHSTNEAERVSISREGADGSYEYIIMYEPFDYSIEAYNSLSHEIIHQISIHLRECGIEHIKETEEAYTYYFNYIFTKCLKEIDKRYKK